MRSPGEAPSGPVALSPAGAQAVTSGAAWVEAGSTAAAEKVMVIRTPFFWGRSRGDSRRLVKEQPNRDVVGSCLPPALARGGGISKAYD